MMQVCINSELSFQNFAVYHGNQCRAKVVTNLDQFTAFHLLIVFDWLLFL